MASQKILTNFYPSRKKAKPEKFSSKTGQQKCDAAVPSVAGIRKSARSQKDKLYTGNNVEPIANIVLPALKPVSPTKMQQKTKICGNNKSFCTTESLLASPKKKAKRENNKKDEDDKPTCSTECLLVSPKKKAKRENKNRSHLHIAPEREDLEQETKTFVAKVKKSDVAASKSEVNSGSVNEMLDKKKVSYTSTSSDVVTKPKTNLNVDQSNARKTKVPAHERFEHLIAPVQKLNTKLSRKQTVTVEVPRKPEQAELVSESSKKIPAHEKFQHLVTPVPPSLTLPHTYKLLGEMFRCVDTIVGMLHNRMETATYSRIKSGVQEMCRKTFEITTLGKIKKVYPTAYAFRQEKGLPYFGNSMKTGDYQLTVEPVIEDQIRKNDTKSNEGSFASRSQLTASMQLSRRKIFHAQLINVVKAYHKVWLANLEKPLSVPDDKITRWHPKFPLNDVPDIEPVELPQPPVEEKYETAQAVLNKAQGMLSKRAQAALQQVAKEENIKNEPKVAQTDLPDSQKKPAVPVGPALNGISTALLEKIRAKEAEKTQRAMVRSESENKKLAMMARLPEMCRILRTYIITEKKSAVSLEGAVEKLTDSYHSSITQVEITAHIHLMAELVPRWLTITKVRKGVFLKIDKNKDVQVVCQSINKLIREKQ